MRQRGSDNSEREKETLEERRGVKRNREEEEEDYQGVSERCSLCLSETD